MSYIGKFYPFLDTVITLTYPDDSTEAVTLSAPNARNPFRWGFVSIEGRRTYRDGNYALQRKRERYQLIAELSYNFHNIELADFLRAKRIEIKIPIWWGPVTYYVPVTVMLDRSDAFRDAYGGIAGGKIHDAVDQARIIPQAATSFRFIGVTPLEWDEIGSEQWPFVTPRTAMAVDGDGNLTPLLGLKIISSNLSAIVLQQINGSAPLTLPVGTVQVRDYGSVLYDVSDVTILPFST